MRLCFLHIRIVKYNCGKFYTPPSGPVDIADRSGHVLRYVWKWAVIAALGLETQPLCGTMLTHLARLPWNQHWFHVECLLVVPQVTFNFVVF